MYARTAHGLLPKDFVRRKLTGGVAGDHADGSATVLTDLRKRDGSDEPLDALEIPCAGMPPLCEGTQVAGYVNAEAAAVTGLKAGTPVVAGGGDQSAQAVGVGGACTHRRRVLRSAGTPARLSHAVPGMGHLMGVMLSAAGSVQWYRDTLAPSMSFDELLKEAGGAPPGSEGLQFLPYLSGERTLHADPLARGAWVSMTLRHGRAPMTRAVLEGVAFGLKDGLALIQQAGLSATSQVRASGGGLKGAFWRQILASVLEAELVTVNPAEGAAYGTA